MNPSRDHNDYPAGPVTISPKSTQRSSRPCPSHVKCCPKALNLVIINPVNFTIPISCEVPDEADISERRRILGVITLYIVLTITLIEAIVPVNKSLYRTIAKLPPAHPANPARMTHRNEAQVFISFQIKFTIIDSILRASQGEMMV